MGNYTTDQTLSLIDGVNIRSLHAFIEKATGFLDEPEQKAPYKYSWPDEHGIDIDMANVYFNERKCSLDLIVHGDDFADLVVNLNALKAIFRATLLRHLKLYGVNGIFLLKVNGVITVSRLGRGLSGRQLARLSLPLIDPYPVKLQYYADQRSVRDTVSLLITTSKSVMVDWGDNHFSSLNQTGTVSHDYSAFGEYCVIVYGSVQGVSSIEYVNLEEIDSVSGGVIIPGEDVTADSTTVTADNTTITADQQ